MPESNLPWLILIGAAAAVALLFWPGRGLLPRWQAHRAAARTTRLQDALKQARLCELEGEPISEAGLARRLSLPPKEAAALAAELATAGWLTPDGDLFRLTPAGREAGAQIIRAHRLWERHLAEDTGFAETEWHPRAEVEEHRLTPSQTEDLARRLGQPTLDPHGDPIPTADGELVLHAGHPLDRLPVGAAARISHVEDEPAEVYNTIVAAGLAPGAVVHLLDTGRDGLLVQVNGERRHLPLAAGASIAVVPLPAPAPPEAPHGDPLFSLRLGERAQILELSPRCRGAERRRMLDLGLLPGTTIEAVMASPTGDPTAYLIRDALIALRHEQAGLIRIVRPPEATRG